MKKNIEAAIAAVTVYTDRALVTRKNTISLTGEETEIILPQLPVVILPDSVRVTGKGTSAVNILGVRIKNIFTSETAIATLAELESQIQTLKTQEIALDNRSQAEKLRLNFVEQLSDKSIQYAIALAKQQTDLEQIQALLDFVGDKYLEYSDRTSELERQLQNIEDRIVALERQKQELQIPKDKEHLNLIILIDPSAAGEFELEVSYLVKRASWTPLYDLQVNTSEKQLNLTYLAEVKQNTGEDWHNVPITLSTAKPGLGIPPKIEPWYIDVDEPVVASEIIGTEAIVRTSLKSGASKRRRSRRSNDEMADIIPTAFVEAEVVAATVSKSGSVVTFEVGNSGDIPSDNTPHKVTIFRNRFPVKLEYIAIPRLVSFAYLQATVTNPATGVTLLPGKANIFREQTFVGTTNLDNVAPAQNFTLNLGIDEGWKIERNLVQRQVDKKLIGGNKRVTYAYRIIVNNLLAGESSLKLIEQLPVSRDERIKVRLTQAEPKIKQGEMGVLEWMLISAGEQTINYQFTLEYPLEILISGLDI